MAAVGALLAAAVLLAYCNSFGIGFHFDDITGIAENPSVRSLRNIPSFFTDPYTLTRTRENVDVRGVLQTTFALNYAISGLNPWSWHALNLLLHFVAALLVFLIVRDDLWPAGVGTPHVDGTVAGAAAALFFALAPLNSQPVDYIWARSALLSTTLYLGAFYCFLRDRWVLMAFLHALALLTKAIALTLPVTIVLYVALYSARKSGVAHAARRAAIPVAMLAVLNVAYFVYRASVLSALPPDTFKEAWVTPSIWMKSQWPAQLYYVRLFLWPDALSIDHDFPYALSLREPRAWISLTIIVAWIGASLALVKRHRIVAFATLWFFVTLAIESTFWPLAEVINDHRPYLASALGLAVLLAWLLDRAVARAGRPRAVFVGAAALVCAAAIPMDLYRNWQWSDYVRIWEDAARKGPGNGRAWMNAGTGLMSRGDLAGARRDFERARQAAPSYAYVYMNLAVLDMHEGRLGDALNEAEHALTLNPSLSLTHYYLGQALEKNGRTGEAAAEYERALAIDPRSAQAAAALAALGVEGTMRAGLDALYTKHDPAAAAARFREVLAAMPSHYGATYQLAKALDLAGRRDEARPLWEKMLAMADAIHDRETAATCRARLQASP